MRPACQVPLALAGAVCLLGLAGGPALAADADATPGLAAPSGTLRVLVSCDPVDGRSEGSVPEDIQAVSNAFAHGMVKLRRHQPAARQSESPGSQAQAAGGVGGPVYRGWARLAPASVLVPDVPKEALTRTSQWDVGGVCPGGEQWTANFRVDHELTRPTPPDQGPSSSSSDTSGQGPVSSNVGGAGEDYQPVSAGAVAAGSALIVGTVAVVVYRRMREVRNDA